MIHTDGTPTIANAPRRASDVKAPPGMVRLTAADVLARRIPGSTRAALDCTNCGEPVKRNWGTCPDCGEEIAPSADFPVDPASPHGGHMDGSRKQHGDALGAL